jgi:hypothetical protein
MQRWQLRARRWETSALHRRNTRHHAGRAAQHSASGPEPTGPHEHEEEQLPFLASANDPVPAAALSEDGATEIAA